MVVIRVHYGTSWFIMVPLGTSCYIMVCISTLCLQVQHAADVLRRHRRRQHPVASLTVFYGGLAPHLPLSNERSEITWESKYSPAR